MSSIVSDNIPRNIVLYNLPIKETKFPCDILSADDTSDSPDYPQIDNAWQECLICNKKFKSEITSQNHDKKLHMTPGPGKDRSFKCDNCSETNLNRQELYNHILNKHKKCTICEKICPNQNSFENHMKVIHHTSSSKHTL